MVVLQELLNIYIEQVVVILIIIIVDITVTTTTIMIVDALQVITMLKNLKNACHVYFHV